MKRLATHRNRLILGFLAAFMSACGGGDGNGSTQSGTYDLKAGYANLVTMGLTSAVSFSGNVVADGVTAAFTGSGTYTLTAGASTTFNDAAALSQDETIAGTVTVDGQSQAISSAATNFYATGTYAYLGLTATGEYAVAQAPLTYPDSVVVGSAAVLGTVSVYSDSTMSTPVGSSQVSYAVTSSDVANSLTVTITTQDYDTSNDLLETDVATYTLSSANVLSFVSLASTTSTGNVTITAD